MEPSSPYRPRVSRETRLLLITGIVALAVLWLLARVRFQDRLVTPSPVPAVLSQLGKGPSFDELASDLAELQASLDPLLVMIGSSPERTATESSGVIAIRWQDDLAIGLLPPHGPWPPDADLRARDPASGIAVFRTPLETLSAPVQPWVPRRPQQPRFVAVAEPAPDRPSLRPVFLGGLVAVETPLWPGPVWSVPSRVDLAPGSFLFTSNAELVGLVVAFNDELLIVPAAVLLDEASRVLDRQPGPQGTLGVETQALTPALASLTGASTGVIVTWVDGGGPGGATLRVGDVIDEVDGRPLATRQEWDVWCTRLRAGSPVTLRVRRGGDARDVTLTAAEIVPKPANGRELGLSLRAKRGVGAEVVSIDAGSAAARAGLAAGDLITLFGDVASPAPAQVARIFAALPAGGRAMVAFTRADTHHVTVVER